MFPLSAVRRILPPLLALLLAAPLAAAQKPAAGDRFEETSEVVAVEVPVNVVGRDGQPVRGLTAADFEVFEIFPGHHGVLAQKRSQTLS